MSKGGAGKVYFVLYLAVILELLIIIVERDEAEEALHKRQKETMRIVKSILSQLQTGAGTEGINTRPQDQILIPPQGMSFEEFLEQAGGIKIKKSRDYVIDVGVTDISKDWKWDQEGEEKEEYVDRLKKLFLLANVSHLEYQIFFTPRRNEADTAYAFPSDKVLDSLGIAESAPGDVFPAPDGAQWELKSRLTLELDSAAKFQEIERIAESRDLSDLGDHFLKQLMDPAGYYLLEGPSFGGPYFSEYEGEQSFYYLPDTAEVSIKDLGALERRSFMVNFMPAENEPGFYKLRFWAKKNTILGVRPTMSYDELDKEETKVNIGTVQLTVKSLETVVKNLYRDLAEQAPDIPNWEDFIGAITAQGSDPIREIREFDQTIKDIKVRVSHDEGIPDRKELLNQIDLYNYITRLLAPGMSSYFEQNQGSMKFDVNVVQQEFDVIVGLSAPREIPTYEDVPPAITFSIAPWKSRALNQVTAELTRAGTPVGTNVKVVPLYEYEGKSEPEIIGDDEIEYIAVVEGELDAGNCDTCSAVYKMKITHKLQTEAKSQIVQIPVYRNSLSQTSRQTLDGTLMDVEYGDYIRLSDLNIDVAGKNDFKPDQFITTFKTETDGIPSSSQLEMGQTRGYSSQDLALKICENASTVQYKLEWIQPFTGKKSVLYENKQDIVQNKILVQPPKGFSNTYFDDQEGFIVFADVNVLTPQVDCPQEGTRPVYASIERENITVSVNAEPSGSLYGQNFKYKASSDISFNLKELTDGIYAITDLRVPFRIEGAGLDKFRSEDVWIEDNNITLTIRVNGAANHPDAADNDISNSQEFNLLLKYRLKKNI